MHFPPSYLSKRVYLLPLIFCFFFYPALASTENWKGKVVGVIDGDTIVVFNGYSATKIRVSEIDCPEDSQPFSKAAKKFTSDFCFGKDVLIIPETTDRYGRTVAHVRTLEGEDLSAEIIVSGLAWHYKKYSTSELLSDLEQTARLHKRGLWIGNDPIAPWHWRNGIRNSSQINDLNSSITNEFHGNVRSMIFHKSTCKHYNCMNCQKIFKSRDEALQNGYRPCGFCLP